MLCRCQIDAATRRQERGERKELLRRGPRALHQGTLVPRSTRSASKQGNHLVSIERETAEAAASAGQGPSEIGSGSGPDLGHSGSKWPGSEWPGSEWPGSDPDLGR